MRSPICAAAILQLGLTSVAVQAQAPDQKEIDTGITKASIPSPEGPSFTYKVSAEEVACAMKAARVAHAGGQPFKNGDPFLHLLFFAGPNMVSIENRPTPAPDCRFLEVHSGEGSR